MAELNLENIDLGGFGLNETPVEQPLKSTMSEAVKVNPDEQAHVNKLSTESGVPSFAVESDPKQVENQLKFDQIDFDTMSKRSPNTSQYLVDFNNAAVAHDDVDVLESIEDVFNFRKTFENIGGSIVQGFKAQVQGLGAAAIDARTPRIEDLIPEAALPVGMKNEAFEMSQEFAANFGIESDADMVKAKGEAVEGILTRLRETKAVKQKLQPEDLNTLEQGIRGGVESLANMAPGFGLMLLSGGQAAPLLATIGVQSFGASYAEGRAEGLSDDRAKWFGLIDAAIEVGTEMIPIKTLENFITGETKGLGKKALKFAIQEMGTEQLATLGQSLNQYVFGLDEQIEQAETVEEIVNIQMQRQAVTAIATVVAGGAQIGIATGVRKTMDAVQSAEARKAQEYTVDQQTIDRLNEQSEKSKLKARDKESFKQFVEKADDNNNTTVFIDASQTALYLQGKTQDEIDSDPALQILNEQVREAAVVGGEVQIPVAEFAGEIAGTEHFEALRDSMTMSEDLVSPFRQEQAQVETQSYVQRMMTEAQENVAEYAEAQEIYQDVRQQLIDSGRVTPQNASVMANLVPAWATAKAQRENKSVQQVYEESGLKIEGPLTGERARIEGELDVLTQTSEQVAEFRKANNLPEIKMRKDSSHPTQITGTKKTYRKIFDTLIPDEIKGGKILDYGAGKNIAGKELGKEADISSFEPFPEKDFTPTYTDTVDIPSNEFDAVFNNAVLNVVPDDIRNSIVLEIGRVLKAGGKAYINTRGKDVFNANHTVIDKDNMEVIIKGNGAYQKGFKKDELVSYLQETLGPDFTVESAKFGAVGAIVTKIKSTSNRGTFDPADPNILRQEVDTTTENFEKWFGDSKVVDDAGEPLVVYHGTDQEFTEFKTEGGRIRKGKLGKGIYLTPSEKTGKFFASIRVKKDGGKPVIMPLYASLVNPYVIDSEKNIPVTGIDRNKLQEAGYDGIILKHEGSKEIKEIVAFNPTQIKSVNNRGTFDPADPNIFKQPTSEDVNGARGYYDPENSLIRMTETSNLSTFLHEYAHFMYDMEDRGNTDMSRSITNWFNRDSEAVATEASKYLNKEKYDAEKQDGAGTRGKVSESDVTTYIDQGTTESKSKDAAINRAIHERFARGFETYLMEGKAPSIELRNAFATIARWLTQIYTAIKGDLNVNLDAEMRQIYDRLLATDEQIAAAEARNRFEPMFTTAAMAGMTEEEFEAYKKKQEKTKDKQTETLREKLIKQLTRRTKKWWREEKADVVRDETEVIKTEKVYVTGDQLRTGDVKLDFAATKDIAGEEKVDKIGRKSIRVSPKLRGMTAKEHQGVHPDQAAAMFGYTSGAEMLHDIINAPSVKDLADTRAEAVMIERHGDIMNDGTIERAADDAVKNEERGAMILQELKVLSRGTAVPTVDRKTIKAIAKEKIGQLSFREIFPGKYRKAEIKASQEAAVALKEGDKQTAASAKLRQVMNYYLGMEAAEAKADTMKIVDRMSRYNKKKVREEIMKAGNDYWEQLDKILNRFEFRKSATLKSVDNVNIWMKDQVENEGAGLTLSNPVLDEGYITHWKNVPYTDLQGINDSVKNIEHVARYSNKIDLLQEKVDFQKVVNDWVDSMNEKVESKFKSTASVADDPAQWRKWGRWAMAQMTKIPFMASWLDGGERVGMSHQILVQRFTDAYDAEVRLWNESAKPVMDLILNRSKEDVKRHNTKYFIPEIQGTAFHTGNMMGHEIIAVALNTGNESNLRKLLLGEGWANPDDDTTISFQNPKLQAVLSKMTASDWQLVQTIWDQMETLYPALAEVHRKTTGLTPPKIEKTPIEVQGMRLAGGYYPMKYDPSRDNRAQEQEDRLNAEVESMFSNTASIQASVNIGATNERTKYYAPVRLSLDVVQNHFQETIHYITHHDAVRQVNKLIRNNEVTNTIKEKLGPDEYAQLKPWLNDIAKDGREAPVKTYWDDVLQKLRFGVTLGVMGFKASTGIIQISGLSNTVAEMGLGNTLQAMRSVVGSPADMRGAWDFASENSKVMNHRVNTMDREIKNAMSKLADKKGLKAAVQEASMKHIALIQTYMVDLPTWHAGYITEMKRSGDEQKSYQYADWVIENIQGSGLTKDMASIMRGQSETGRMLTMFMTFFSSLWNMQRDLTRGAKSGAYSKTTVAAKAMFLFAVPVVFEMLMRGDFDADEPEENLQKMLTGVALYPVQSVPFVRDIASATFGEYGYNISPVASLIEQGTRSVPGLLKAPFTDKEITKSQLKGVSKVAGAAAGLPGVNQAWATGEHLYEVLEEGEELTFHQLLFGSRRD